MSGRNQNNFSKNFSPQNFLLYPNYYDQNIYQQYPNYYMNNNNFYSQENYRGNGVFHNKKKETNQNGQCREIYTGDNKTRTQTESYNQIKNSNDFFNSEYACTITRLKDLHTGRHNDGITNQIKFTHLEGAYGHILKSETYNVGPNNGFNNQITFTQKEYCGETHQSNIYNSRPGNQFNYQKKITHAKDVSEETHKSGTYNILPNNGFNNQLKFTHKEGFCGATYQSDIYNARPNNGFSHQKIFTQPKVICGETHKSDIFNFKANNGFNNQIPYTQKEGYCGGTHQSDMYNIRRGNQLNNQKKFSSSKDVSKLINYTQPETQKSHIYKARKNKGFCNNNFLKFKVESDINKTNSNTIYTVKHNGKEITHAEDECAKTYTDYSASYNLYNNSFCNKEFSNVKSDKKETHRDCEDSDIMQHTWETPKKRTISKVALLQKIPSPVNDLKFIKQKSEPSYTDEYWQKQQYSDNYNNQPSPMQQPRKKANKFEKMLNDMLSAPVEMSKGKSLLEKMGWQGGGLGKDGEGIVEPIAPKGTYATSTMGLGQLSSKTKNAKKKRGGKKEDGELNPIERLYANTLFCLLDFVKNDLEIELLFDKTLTKNERKRVHHVVDHLRNCNTKAKYSSLVEEINDHNHYVLYTVSEGEGPNRQLIVYKEAPEYVYLITPDDLADDEDEESEGKSVIDIIVNYFFEYIENDEYTEFRFLGPFDPDQKCSIDRFFAVCRGECAIPESEKVLKSFQSEHHCLEMEEDSNGKIVIYKNEKKPDLLEQKAQDSKDKVQEIL